VTETAANTELEARHAFAEARRRHWDALAGRTRRGPAAAYARRLARIYRSLVAPGLRVLEIGCAGGDLLAALEPSCGVGVDLSEQMLSVAAQRHPGLRFVHADAHDLALDETFDVVILSDLVNELWDVQAVLERVRSMCTPQTRLIINSYSRLWQPPLALAKALGLAAAVLDQNWLTPDDIRHLLGLAGFELLRRWSEILLPLPLPGLDALFNRFLVKLWPLRVFGLTNFLVARPAAQPDRSAAKPLVSVIVPARNEAGNVEAVFARTPEMGAGTELVFVEGHSTDGTAEAVEAAMKRHPERRCRLLRQSGRGKADAVRLGFAEARGEVLMILDADVTVPPESLPRFYEALVAGRGELINGVRLVYPMPGRAMRFCNLIGNKFFSLAFSWLLGQPVKDCLCGTKALTRLHYQMIAANRSHFGDFDPFGDFDLIFGASRLNLKIVDLPVRYRERTYGQTNISRWRHGWLLLRMLWFAAWRIKFT